jgi:hypothetical protein
MELKSSHHIIRYYMKIKEIHITSKVKKVTRSRMKEEKAKHKIQILGDNHARGLANELKYKLTRDYEILLYSPIQNPIFCNISEYAKTKTLSENVENVVQIRQPF